MTAIGNPIHPDALNKRAHCKEVTLIALVGIVALAAIGVGVLTLLSTQGVDLRCFNSFSKLTVYGGVVFIAGGIFLMYIAKAIATPKRDQLTTAEDISPDLSSCHTVAKKQQGLNGTSLAAPLSIEGNNPEKKFFKQDLQKELLEMQERDQSARMQYFENPSDEAGKNMLAIDEKHAQRLRKIIDQYGWPGVSMVGQEGASAAWLLAQHLMDLDFQKECLELLRGAVEIHEASKRDLAYLTDKVKMFEKCPQVFGTQWIQIEGKWALHPVEDIVNLDVRRASVGLCSIAEYKEKIIEVYHLTNEDFSL